MNNDEIWYEVRFGNGGTYSFEQIKKEFYEALNKARQDEREKKPIYHHLDTNCDMCKAFISKERQDEREKLHMDTIITETRKQISTAIFTDLDDIECEFPDRFLKDYLDYIKVKSKYLIL